MLGVRDFFYPVFLGGVDGVLPMKESSPVKAYPLGKTAQRIIDALVDDPTLTRKALDREGSDKSGYWVVLIRK